MSIVFWATRSRKLAFSVLRFVPLCWPGQVANGAVNLKLYIMYA
jgi:hypothetical protein